MPVWTFRTLGPAALISGDRTIPLDDPLLTAFIAVLAIAGTEGIAEDELQLLLTPAAKRDAARRELSRLTARVRELTSIDVSSGTRYVLPPQTMSLDVEASGAQRETACAEFLRDVRVADSPEFDEWLAATRRRVHPLAIAASAPRVGRRRGLIIGSAVAAAVVVAATVFYLAGRRSIGFSTGDVVMLADIANHTRDTVFDKGILTAASVSLEQSGRVRLYSRARLASVYQRMRLTDRVPVLDYDMAQDVAERDHVRWVLGLFVDRASDGYHIDAKMMDVQQHVEIAKVAAVAATRGDVLATLDDVLHRVRRTLGESRWNARGRDAPLPLVTTASLEALRSYAEGSAAWSAARYDQARELWLRAVDLDTGFAMAYGSLGSWHYYHHDRQKGEFYYEEALKRTGRLSEWERLRVLDGQATYRGNVDSAIVVSRTVAERFPSAASWYSYGTSLMQRGRREDATAAFRRALSFDSLHVSSWINLATSAKGLKRYDEAVRFYERAGQIDSSVVYTSNINSEYGGTLVHVGRTADAEALFRRMVAGDRIADRMLGLRSLGWLALWQGRLYEAIGDFQQAVDAAHQSNNSLGEGRNRMLLAGVYRTANRTADAKAEIAKVIVLAQSPSFEPSMLAVLVYACQQLDRPRDVEAVAALLHQRVKPDNRADRTAEAYANGIVQLMRHHPDSAIAFLRTAADFAVKTQVLMSRAEAYQALGMRDSVRAVLSAVLEADGFGAQGQDDWLRAPLLLGDVLLASGDSAGALRRYEEVATRWKDAPPDTPDLVTARARLAALARVKR